jgi:predicted MFS family arabinose efflux permease
MPLKVERDRFFWTVALQTVVVNFFLGGFGPAQSLLQKDQGTTLVIAGLHGTSMGLASIAAGLSLPRLAHKFGRTNSGWLGLVVFSIGLIAVATLPTAPMTIAATFVTGFGISTVINAFVTSMNDHYGAKAPLALAQANGIASVGYVTGTALIGSVAKYQPHFWRIALLACLPLAAYLFFMRREKTVEAHIPPTEGRQGGRLPRLYWFTWIGFVASISTEFATAFWASSLVEDRTKATAAISTIAIVALGTGMGFGRFFGGKILHRLTLDNQLITILALQFLGFFGLWFSHTLVYSLAMLLLIGVGISMQFALTSLRLISHSDGRPDLAIGTSSFGAGIAIAGAPFLLTVLATHLGISRAYLMVPVLIVFAALIIKLFPAKLEQEVLDDLQL